MAVASSPSYAGSLPASSFNLSASRLNEAKSPFAHRSAGSSSKNAIAAEFRSLYASDSIKSFTTSWYASELSALADTLDAAADALADATEDADPCVGLPAEQPASKASTITGTITISGFLI